MFSAIVETRQKYFCMSVTSVVSEPVFIMLGTTVNAKSNKITDNIDMVTFLAKNL